MTELSQNTTIQDAAYALTDQVNFQYLKQLGLDAIVRTASDKWTDYNEHDPGITILEVLVYVLTDLGYRTDFSITDILAQAKAPVEELAQNEFYTARTILTVNPVSRNDYRRIIIDLDGVANAWVLPSQDPMNPFKGLVDIWVNAEDKLKTETELETLRALVQQSFFAHRNLSQDLVQVKIREKVSLGFKMQLILDPKKVKNVEKVLAEVLLAIKSFISEEIHFLSLEQMMVETNSDVNAIFNGPALEHGFLPTKALQDMVRSLKVIQLVPVIQKIAGIAMINDLAFCTNGNRLEWLTKLMIEPEKRLVLGTLEEQTLTVLLGDTPYPVSETTLKFEYEKALHQQANSKLVKSERDLPIVLGDYRDMENYFSLQNEFPTIYGLEPFGPPPDASRERLAQIEQLKGYLFIFDQIMANYLAQLAHLSQLFSWSRSVARTYFFQGLTGAVRQIESLLVDPKATENSTLDAKVILDHYQQKLAGFTEDRSTYLSRRNRFLDHLLARFGRQLIVETRHLKYELITIKEQEEAHSIDAKLRILEQYPDLSANRARAFSVAGEGFARNFSGLRNWVETLFFMEPESLEKYHFNQRFTKQHYDAKEADKKLIYSESEFILKTVPPNPVKKKNRQRAAEVALDLREIMRIGTDPSNYYLDHLEEVGYRIYLYKQTEILKAATVYELAKRYQTPEAALTVIDQLVTLLQRYNRSSESIYVIEPLLFRPMDNEAYFGLNLLDEKGTYWLGTKKWYAKNALAELQKPLRVDQYYYDVKLSAATKIPKAKKTIPKGKKKTAKYNFFITAGTNDFGESYFTVKMRYFAEDRFVYFHGKEQYMSIKAARQSIEQWMQRYEQQLVHPAKQLKLYQAKLSPWVAKRKKKKTKTKNKKGGKKSQSLCLELDVFSNILTIVLPDWPSRFQRKGFKKTLEQQIRREAPAHLWLNILWLEKNKFQKFQRLFGRWWDAYTQKLPDAYTFRAKIANFLTRESYDQLVDLSAPENKKAKA